MANVPVRAGLRDGGLADVVRSQQATIDRLSRLLEDKEQELRELRTEIKLEKQGYRATKRIGHLTLWGKT